MLWVLLDTGLLFSGDITDAVPMCISSSEMIGDVLLALLDLLERFV